jgi:quercetin dioxygenase-like cupin family protein
MAARAITGRLPPVIVGPHRIRPLLIALAACALLAAGAAVGWAVAPDAAAPTAKRTALARALHPRGAPGRTLGLSRVVIPPGGKIPLHHHEGTQVAYIQSGVLTYHVKTGSVTVRRGNADEHPRVVHRIKAGHTGRIHPGEWIVEQPSTHHAAANNGKQKIVIYLGTLLRTGAPPSTPG